jgi:glycosyltransferase involved in cell wall biosynthesis
MSTKTFPKISVITPSFNQAQFLEKTINSVLSQNYPNLEYIVVDGKSTDGSHDIIKKYLGKISWIDETDKNQAEAINKGFRKSSGDILAYLNSDDTYNTNTLSVVAEHFTKNPKETWVTGDCIIVDETEKEISRSIRIYKTLLSVFNSRNTLAIANFISQPSTFIKRSLFDEIGYLNESLEYAMDLDYWLRCYRKAKPLVIRGAGPLSRFRVHTKSKGGGRFTSQFQEVEEVLKTNQTSEMIRALNHVHNKLIIILYTNFYKKSL